MGMENAPKAALPSKESMRIFAEKMRAVGVGAETKEYRGHRGNLVYLNDLPAMIAEAIANPLIRQHLTFLPENTPNQLQEIYQAEKWLEELSPHLLTPCVQYRSSLFFTDEVTELEGSRYFIVSRWILQNSEIVGRGHEVLFDREINGFIVDCRKILDIPLKKLLYNGLSTQEHLRERYCIKGVITEAHGLQQVEALIPISTLRAAHQGKRVVTVPVILYADDSSGNRSKKWNKHLSFYATLAGLPNKLQQQEYFFNFLGTSNVASALELLEGVASQILDAWDNPQTTFDAELGEEVVYRPSLSAECT
ncbi:hypothetical protein BT69DRAFT_1344369 [Atractiella rhizophila]|nr:hypothetical protein BT69DRAFT_1344369 [Atractiella rhizophila]